MRLLSAVLLGWLAMAALGCGDDDDMPSDDGGAEDGGPDGGGGDARVDARTADATIVGQGFMLLRSETNNHELTIQFRRVGQPGFCPTFPDGPCVVQNCLGGSLADVAPTAGVVQIMGANEAIAVTPMNGFYPRRAGTTDLWSGGETLRFSAPGADVPAFDQTLIAPTAVTVTTPAAGTAFRITPGQPASFAWTGGGGANFVIALQTSGGPLLKCSFPANAGQGTIPGGVTARLMPGSATMFLLVEAYRALELSGWDLRFAARRFARTTSIMVQ